MKRRIGILVVCVCLATMTGAVAAFEPELAVAYQHDAHEAQIVDVEYSAQTGVVFSLDQAGTFVAYNVEQEDVAFTHSFEVGHSIAIGDKAVYVAAGDTLWEYDVAAGNISELTSLQDHLADLAYAKERDVIWGAGAGTVYGYSAADGSLVMQHSEHSDGLASIDARGDYVVSGTTWQSEVIVYDVAAEAVAFQPTLPDDVGAISALRLTESGELLVGTGAEEGDVIAAYDLESQERLHQYRQHLFSVSEVMALPDSNVIASTGYDNTVKFYDRSTESVVATYEHDDTIYAAAHDRQHDVIWFGDGEEGPGTLVGLDVSTPEPTATPTPEPSQDETATSTDESGTSPTATSTEESMATTTAPTETGGQPGFGAGLAVLGLALLALRSLGHRE